MRKLLAAIVATVALLSLVATAQAHGILVASEPEEGARLDSLPPLIRLTFSEPLEAEGSQAELFRSGEAVDARYELNPQNPTEILLRPAGPGGYPGHYLVVFQTLSAIDGHVRRGSLTFTVLNPDGSLPEGQSGLAAEGGAGLPGWLAASLKAGLLLALALGAGLALYGMFPLPQTEGGPARGARLLAFSAVSLLVFLLLDLALTLVRVYESFGFDGLPRFVLETRPGTFWLARLALVLAILGALRTRPVPGVLRWPLTATLGALVALLSYTGHAGTPPGEVWATFTDAAHVAAAAVWVAGLAVAVLVVRDPREAARHSALQAFSRRALAALVVVLATGTLEALVRLPSLQTLVESRYGMTLLIKLGMVGGLLLLAAYNSRRVGLLKGESGRPRPSRSMALELTALVAVIGIAGTLSESAPPVRVAVPSTASPNPASRFEAERRPGEAELTVWIEPATAGPNLVTVFVEDPPGRVEAVTVDLYSGERRLETATLQPSGRGDRFEGVLEGATRGGLYRARVNLRVEGQASLQQAIDFEARASTADLDAGPVASPFASAARERYALAIVLFLVSLLLVWGMFNLRSPRLRLSSSLSAGAVLFAASLLAGSGLLETAQGNGYAPVSSAPGSSASSRDGVREPGRQPPEGPTAEAADGRSGTADLSQATAWSLETFDLGEGLGVMMPAVDGEGDVWVGSMNENAVYRLDHDSGKVSRVEIPSAQPVLSIMGADFDGEGRLWFAGQAGVIGVYDPGDGSYREYGIGEGSGPTDIEVGADGAVWFTALGANAVGNLAPDSGVTRLYPLPTQKAYPYGLAIAADGTLWFSEFVAGRVGRLDPATGEVEEFELPAESRPVGIDVDSRGRVWFVEARGDRLGVIDPESGGVTTYDLPEGSAVYGLLLSEDDAVWLAGTAGAIYRFDPTTEELLRLDPGEGSGPFWLAGSGEAIWVSLGGTDDLLAITRSVP